MNHDWKEISRRLQELADRARAGGQPIDIQEFVEILALHDDCATLAKAEGAIDDPVTAHRILTVGSGQLRAVMKEMHDRGASEISLIDLLERLRVGPLQQPASKYMSVRRKPCEPEHVSDREQALRRLAELIRTGGLDVISPEELAELRGRRGKTGAHEAPDLRLRRRSQVIRAMQPWRKGSTRIGPADWTADWLSYSPSLDHGLVHRAWARTFCRLGVHLFDQVFSLELGARLYCDACGRRVALRGRGKKQ